MIPLSGLNGAVGSRQLGLEFGASFGCMALLNCIHMVGWTWQSVLGSLSLAAAFEIGTEARLNLSFAFASEFSDVGYLHRWLGCSSERHDGLFVSSPSFFS